MKRVVYILIIAILVAGAIFALRTGKIGGVLSSGKTAGEVRTNPKDGAEMVWVPAGQFIMGTTEKQAAELLGIAQGIQDISKFHFNAEQPQRKVYLDGYWIYKNEVTVGQYRNFCIATKRIMPDPPKWDWRDKEPMVNVTWQDAADYAKWAGASLPTEAQWEKAARGTDGRIYPWGNDWDPTNCANSVTKVLKRTMPVGNYSSGASPYGCMDMAGNVWEWCADWFDPSYYKTAPSRNPMGPKKASEFEVPIFGKFYDAKVMRGGTWDGGAPDYYRCADRNYLSAAQKFSIVGFRCVVE